MPKYAGQFSVYAWDMYGAYERVEAFVDAQTAVEIAHRVAETVGAKLGLTQRIIITDGGDCTVFEWRHGKGVTFPPQAVRATAHTPPLSS